MPRPLRPTLREKKRYIMYEPEGINDIRSAYKHLFGIVGLAHAGIISVRKLNDAAIMRVSHKFVDHARAAILWSGRRSIRTSGTLKQLKGDY